MAEDVTIAAMTNAQKQQLNDSLAAIGMLMVTAQLRQQQQPDATLERKMRLAAAKSLNDVLGINAAQLELTATGL